MKHILKCERGCDNENKENYIKTRLHDLYSSFNIAAVSKSLIMKWVAHIAHMLKTTNGDTVSVILVTKPQTERSFKSFMFK